jgi:predicted ATP-dependent endonuclease of OLD family
MKLHKIHIREFKSVWDSNSFDIDRVACLVGKNESGKTAVLQALYRLNPIVDNDGDFDITNDYPRSEVENYQQDIENKRRQHATVVEATFRLEQAELEAIRNEYGEGVLAKPEIVVSKGYAKNSEKKSALLVDVPVVQSALVKNLVDNFELPQDIKGDAARNTTLAELAGFLTKESQRQEKAVADATAAANQIQDEAEKAAALEKSKALAESEQAKALRARLTDLLKQKNIGLQIWQTILIPHFPKFLYFDEYYQMRGHDNVEALIGRKTAGKLLPSDHPLLGLIDLARLDLQKLTSPSSTQDLKNKGLRELEWVNFDDFTGPATSKSVS